MNKQGAFSGPWFNIGLILTIAISGFYLTRAPLRSSRPPSNSQITETLLDNKSILRAWEDPFNCLEKAKKQHADNAPVNQKLTDQEIDALFKDLAISESPLRILALVVMVPGKNFEDRVERRIRSRVAVNAGLSEAKFAPTDAESMGYFSFKPKKDEKSPASCEYCQWHFVSTSQSVHVPFEWFRITPGVNKENNHVLVLWLNEDEIKTAPLHYIFTLQEKLNKAKNQVRKSKDVIDFRVIGPWHSSVLETLQAEAKKIKEHSNDLNEKLSYFGDTIRMFNVTATHQPEVMTKKDHTTTEIEHVLHVTHIISSDEQVAKALVQELKLRPIWRIPGRSNPEYVLIAEHDTLYGRELPGTFSEVMLNEFYGLSTKLGTADKKVISDQDAEKRILRYSYLRGLDGSLATDNKTGTNAPDLSKIASQQMGLTDRALPSRPANRSFGNNQIDYVIRLAEQIKARTPYPKAIGILGSDTYDKLLLVNELRHHFPFTVFFTTDLDAVLTDVQESQWTKNMIVTSSHGFRLDETFQSKFPEFRSNYQTAMFQGVLAACGDAGFGQQGDQKAFSTRSEPRVFEIGVNRVHDLSMNFGDKAAVHPKPRPLSFFDLAGLVVQAILGFFFITLLFFTLGWHKIFLDFFTGNWVKDVCPKGSFSDEKIAPRIWKRLVTISRIILFLLCLIVVGIFFNHFLPSRGGEKYVALDGVSVWPTVLIQWVALFLAWTFFIGAVKRLRKTRGILDEYLLDEGEISVKPDTFPGWKMLWGEMSKLKRFIAQNGFRRIDIYFWGKYVDKKPRDNVEASDNNENKNVTAGLWTLYQKSTRTRYRSLIPPFSLLIFMVAVPVLGWGSSWSAARGMCFNSTVVHVSFGVAFLMWSVSWGGLFLLAVFIAMENYACARFVSILKKFRYRLEDFTVDMEKDGNEGCPQWRDLRVIGDWTYSNNSLMLFPIVILFILTLARAPIFDNYGQDLGLRTLIALSVCAITFLPMVALRRRAFQLKKDRIEQLRNWEIQLSGRDKSSGNEPKDVVTVRAADLIAQIKLIREDMEKYDNGIYSPLIWHPLFQSALIMTGGTTLPSFLEILTKG